MRCSNKSYWFHSCQYVGIKSLDELNYILTQKEHYVLLIQRPGQTIRHYGRHFHCILTAIDPTINPTGLSLSIGRRDKYTEDNYSFCSASNQRLTKTSKQGYVQVSRKLYLTQNITKADKRKLGQEFLDRKEENIFKKNSLKFIEICELFR